MRRFPPWMWLILALVFGGTATFIAKGWLTGAKKEAEVKIAPVVVAVRDIETAKPIIPELLAVRHWPAEKIPKGTFAKIDDLKERVTAAPFKAEEPILETLLAPPGIGLTGLVSPHMRAITVKVDEASGVAGFLTPGCRVDVVVVTRGAGAHGESVSKVVLQNLKVLGTGQKTERAPGEKAQVVPTVTLEVTPEDGERLALAAKEGRISLVLRSLKDDEPVATRGVTVSQLLAPPTAPPGLEEPPGPPSVTAPAPPAKPPVEVVRRLKREPVSF